MTAGELAVIGRRLDALELAILARDWTDVERAYDQVRSSFRRGTGERDREVDRLRLGRAAGARNIRRLRRPAAGR